MRFTALMPQFIDAAVPQYIVIGLLFAAIDFTVMFGYAMIGAHAIRLLHRHAVLMLDRACGGALLLLAGSLVFYRRGAS